MDVHQAVAAALEREQPIAVEELNRRERRRRSALGNRHDVAAGIRRVTPFEARLLTKQVVRQR